MVDAAVGLTDLDASMADMLRRSTKPVYVCVNKVDNSTRALEGTEFYGMGFEHNYFVSSISGSGTGEISINYFFIDTNNFKNLCTLIRL